MADVPEVDIVDGLPTGGTGTVKTLSTVTDALGLLAIETGGVLDEIKTATELAAGEIGATDTDAAALGATIATTPAEALDPTNVVSAAMALRVVAYLTALINARDAAADAATTAASVSTRAFQALSTNAATAGTRPANQTPYSANDAVSNHATAGSVVAFVFTVAEANDLPISLEEMMIRSTDTAPGTAAAIFRCFFYQTDPTASTGVVGGDNAAFSTKQGTFLGVMEGTFRAFSDGSCARLISVAIPSIGAAGTAGNVMPTRIVTQPGSGAATVFMLMQTLTAFTPSANSTVFTPTVEGFQFRA